MKFVQVIEFESGDYDGISKLEQEYRAKTEGRRSVGSSYACRDRDNPDNIVVVVVFDSYEAAMKNSELPETGEFAAAASKLAKNVTFRNLDVLDEQ